MRRAAGFTLIEIVVVIALLGILATLGFQTLGNNTSLAELQKAQDEVLAELRRARSEALHQLPPTNGSDAVIAQIDAATEQASVCPQTVNYPYGQLGRAEPPACPSTSNPRVIIVERADERVCLTLAPETGRATRIDCDNGGN